MNYLAFLRGINVGGKSIIAMADLRECFEQAGFSEVRTYIQSGNIFFEAPEAVHEKVESKIRKILKERYGSDIGVIVFSKDEWQKIIATAPKSWGIDPSWKHNLIIMLRPYDMNKVIEAIGELKPDIEKIDKGEGVIYQSLSWDKFGRTTSGKLASNPIYKQMTIRNYNTATKLLKLF